MIEHDNLLSCQIYVGLDLKGYKEIEREILTKLNWDIRIPSPFDYYETLAHIGFSWENDRILNSENSNKFVINTGFFPEKMEYHKSSKLSKNLNKLFRILLRLTCLVGDKLDLYTPKVLFSSCFYLARRLMLVENIWPN